MGIVAEEGMSWKKFQGFRKKDLGMLRVSVTTRDFRVNGQEKPRRQGEEGVETLKQEVLQSQD